MANKWNWRRDIIPIGLIVVAIGLAIYYYPRLPATIPVHYNVEGIPDRYAGKLQGMLIFLILLPALYLLLTFVPFVDPFKRRALRRYKVFLVIRDICLVFFFYIYVLTLISAAAGRLHTTAIQVGIGLLFVLLGNYLPKLPRNFFFGIRCPWTIASEVVWRRTHILGGWLFVIGGLLLILLSLLKVPFTILLPMILGPIILVSAIIYPLLLYRKLEEQK